MNSLLAGVLFGAGLPLVILIVAVADRKGCFSRDAFPTAIRKGAALFLLAALLAVTVLLPAATAGRELDASKIRFAQAFTIQALLLLFLASWWLLSGRPPILDFLALRSTRPWTELGAGVCLGLIGWALTFLVGIGVALGLRFAGLPGPKEVPPLVRWIASLPTEQRLLIVLCAMTMEELHFRAFLQRRLGAVSASLLFLLAHGGYGEPFFLVGLSAITVVLAVSFAKTGSTLAPIAAHGTFDGIQLFIVLPMALKLLEGK